MAHAHTSAFPDPGEFKINSVPLFLLSRGRQTEIVACKGTLVVRTGKPKRTKSGRQVDVEIVRWVATGTSKMLGGEIEFRTTGKGRKLASWVRAGKRGDLPGRARFGMRYEVSTPLGTVDGLSGVATGTVRSFPPRGDVFNVAKQLSLGDLTVTPVACACAAVVDFSIPSN